jgi:hypothetical protein
MKYLDWLFSFSLPLFINDTLKLLKQNHAVLYYFSSFFILFFQVGVISSLIVFSFSLYEVRNFEICLRPGCLNNFLVFHQEAIKLFSWTISFLVSYSTIGAIVVALLSYVNSVSSSALGTHISHYKVFQEYLSFELARKSKLLLSSINSLQWYNVIFNKSRLGSTSVSDQYKEKIIGINILIADSNDKANKANNGSFSYKEHQGRMINELIDIGIRIERAPRNDFYAVETEVLELISSINLEFCSKQDIPKLIDRKYI